MCRVPHFALKRLFAVALLIQVSSTVAWAGSYKILHGFSGRLASNPSSGLVVDKAGNGYGTTSAGGFNNAGAVYQISPKSGFSVIYGFSGPDGRQPQGNLVIDAAGNLYGTTVYGGANQAGCNNQGCGTVFRLSPPTNGGTWTETVLYSFTGADDGANPHAGVVLDPDGDLYGTTMNGGSGTVGVVFQLAPGQGGWTQTVLHSFVGGPDGGNPVSALVLDIAGNIYGTASNRGPGIGGTVFELASVGTGWTYKLLYAFDGSSGSKDGDGPNAGLIFDGSGNLYGTTGAGGEFGFGIVFELTLDGSDWVESILYNFAGGSDGSAPMADLTIDLAGNLYGTTFAGGATGFACLGNGCGTVFELMTDIGGQWTERHFTYPGSGSLGIQPLASLIVDPHGRVYGTTSSGGPLGEGVIFRIVQ